MSIRRLVAVALIAAAFVPCGVRADVAASYTVTLRANNLGKFCVAFHFDGMGYTPFGTPINFASAGDMICDGSNDTAFTMTCRSHPDSGGSIDFSLAGPAQPPPPQLLVNGILPFVLPVPAAATGSLMTALGPGLTYLFDATTVIGTPMPGPITILGCTVPPGMAPGDQILHASGGGALNVVGSVSTGTGMQTLTPTATHTEYDVGTMMNVQRNTPLEITFGNLTTGGEITVYSASVLPGQFPTNFTLVAGDYTAAFFDVSTTASYDPLLGVRVCARYDDGEGGVGDGFVDGVVPPLDETRLAVLHREGTPPQYVPHPAASGTDYAANIICADVDSLSPFVLAVAVDVDGDGVFASDNCPTTPNVDQLDGDSDGAGDACDGCPGDAAKTAPGICGCGVADDIDGDGDGVATCIDPCDNDGSHDIAIKPKLAFKKVNTDETDGNDGFKLKGEFVSATAFDALDPATTGARLIFRTASDSDIADVVVPGGASWQSNGSGTKWKYKDPSGSAGGIVKVQIADRSKFAPNQVKIQVTGANGTYAIGTGDEPIKAIAVIGDGSLGECGETAFTAAQCQFNGAGNALKCK